MFSCQDEKDKTNPDKTLADLTQFVDPFIGTGFHGHVFLGANMPFGAVQLGPVNITEGWDWCSGYHYSDSTIFGFSHTHLSGTGIGDLGDIMLMPVAGQIPALSRGKAGDETSGYYSEFSHDREIARPGYYSVYLDRYKIGVELTSTERVGLHRYKFEGTEQAKIVFDLESGIGWDRPVQTYLEMVSDTLITGFRYSTGWAKDQRIYFAAVLSRAVDSIQLFDSSASRPGTSAYGKKVRAVVSFAGMDTGQVLVKVGISPVSIENALSNISAEAPGWNFDEIQNAANLAWNKELNKIKISTPDTARMRTFYTALYHTMIAPSLFNDHNNDYRGTDGTIHKNASFKNLTTFSLWDTYRAVHPLYTLFQQDRVDDMVNSMLAIYQQQGKLPVWHLVGNETNTMPGYSSVQVIADAWLKGFRGYDEKLAWEAMEATAMQDERGLNFVKQYGYIPADSMIESVAMGMEYAIADWAIAAVAEKMGKEKEADYFVKRAMNYRNYFDTSIRFVRGRVSDKEWRVPFSPFVAQHMKDDFCEGNAWQYTWLAPHDVKGMIALQGGDKKFVEKLDSLFLAQGDMGAHASADITGLIGQYAHGNEPSHHIAYLYAYAGQPAKTADKIRYILDNLYSDKPDGLTGNEDVGQMSAWYILSALGLYQVNPANGIFVFGSPVIDRAEINVGKGRTMEIFVKGNSATNKYIQSIVLNGRDYPKSYISYEDLVKGGKLEISMGATPSTVWGLAPENRPL